MYIKSCLTLFLKYSAAAFCSDLASHYESFFWDTFSSEEWFGTEFRELTSILITRNGIPSCVFSRRRVRNRIMGVFFYFCFMERNSELFSLSRKGLERNSKNFLFRGITGVPSILSSAELFFCPKGKGGTGLCLQYFQPSYLSESWLDSFQSAYNNLKYSKGNKDNKIYRLLSHKMDKEAGNLSPLSAFRWLHFFNVF